MQLLGNWYVSFWIVIGILFFLQILSSKHPIVQKEIESLGMCQYAMLFVLCILFGPIALMGIGIWVWAGIIFPNGR